MNPFTEGFADEVLLDLQILHDAVYFGVGALRVQNLVIFIFVIFFLVRIDLVFWFLELDVGGFLSEGRGGGGVLYFHERDNFGSFNLSGLFDLGCVYKNVYVLCLPPY